MGERSREFPKAKEGDSPAEARDIAPAAAALRETDYAYDRFRLRLPGLPPLFQLKLHDSHDAAVAKAPGAREEQDANQHLLRTTAVESAKEEELMRFITVDEHGLPTVHLGPRTKTDAMKKSWHSLDAMLTEKRAEFQGDPTKTYGLLVEAGKKMMGDPAKLRAFVDMLITTLNNKYDSRKTHDKVGDSNADILNRFLESEGSVKHLICGPIAEFVVRYLNDIGVHAAVISGHQVKVQGESTPHAVVMFKSASNQYVFMGGRGDNFVVEAPNSEVALKEAFKLSKRMGSSGYIVIQGLRNNERYSRFMLTDEAAFGSRFDRLSDQHLASFNAFLGSIDTLDANARRNILQQIKNAEAEDTGLRIRAITIEASQPISEGSTPDVAARVAFEAVNKEGSRRLLIFDTAVAADQQKMGAFWQAVSKTYVESMSLSVQRKTSGPTDAFDESESYGVHGQFEQAIRSGVAGTYVFSGELGYTYTRGESLTHSGDPKSSDFHSFMLQYGYRYVRTVVNEQGVRLNLWIGPHLHATLTESSTEVQDNPEPLTGGGTGATAQFGETAGARLSGKQGTMRYSSDLSFTLLQDVVPNNPSEQKVGLQVGYKIDHATGLAFNLGRGVSVDGKVNFLYLRTPVFEKQMLDFGIGVGILDVGGVRGLDVRFDTGASATREGLDIGSLGHERLRDERSAYASGKIGFGSGHHYYGVGGRASYTTDAVRGASGPSGDVRVAYSYLF